MMDNHYTAQKLHELRELEMKSRVNAGEFIIYDDELLPQAEQTARNANGLPGKQLRPLQRFRQLLGLKPRTAKSRPSR
ncbi:hypothetical protein [Paenibacillus protaetiae]|uniref:Uncharacterized protein n=1 Tax=Paenibacillus protaetiae TaxID=2509456 RepID=A0A4P6EYF9_9BACL|nr:hypothetical protein [Paenibacillus protaetiae]QAY68132.1 hypothetical protein ET464_18895 [Paenibacillus protaetiae]